MVNLSMGSIIPPIFPPLSRDIGYLEIPIDSIPKEIWDTMPVELRQLVFFAHKSKCEITVYHTKEAPEDKAPEDNFPYDEDIIKIITVQKPKLPLFLGGQIPIQALYVAKTGKYVGGHGKMPIVLA